MRPNRPALRACFYFWICRIFRAPLTSIPVLELPGFELPRRQRLHPPLHPAIRRPVTETRRLPGFRLDRAWRLIAAPDLARRLADHIDEFGLVGHGFKSSRNASSRYADKSAPNCLTTSFDNAS